MIEKGEGGSRTKTTIDRQRAAASWRGAANTEQIALESLDSIPQEWWLLAVPKRRDDFYFERMSTSRRRLYRRYIEETLHCR